MKIAFCGLGNELLNGKIADKNGPWLAKKLRSYGISLESITLLGDDYTSLKNYLDQSTADLIIFSGGLGPTKDDLTKSFLSQYYHLESKYNPQAEKIALSHYQRENRTYDRENIHYHELPLACEALYNPVGFAPGIKYVQEKTLCFYPGVPREFQAMINEQLEDLLQIDQKNYSLIFKTWQAPEARIFNHLAPELWKQLEKYGQVASLPHTLGVDIAVEIPYQKESELEVKKKKLRDIIYHSPIADLIWHEGSETIEEIVLKTLESHKLSLSLAESASGGLIAHYLTQVPGCSKVLKGSAVVYQAESKIQVLNVSAMTIKHDTVYSKAVALEMARGSQVIYQSDIALAVTGVAGPGDDQGHPKGGVFIHVRFEQEDFDYQFNFSGDRELVKDRFARVALFCLWDVMRKKLQINFS